MRALIAALSFLTRLPVPRIGWRDGDAAAAVRLYPLAGLAIGAPVATAGWLGALVDPWLGAVLATATWAAVTGALHLDGLADLADGLGAGHGDRARVLAVMAEPTIGTFAAVTLILQIAAKLVLLHLLLPAHGLAVPLAPAAARVGPLIWARVLPPLRVGGMAAAIAGAASWSVVAVWLAALAAACLAVPPLAIAPLFQVGYALWARARLGGVTGDVHGAGIELGETAVLLAAVVYAAA